jgi:TATA-box binding protein (TBP) (component of TFIID and TFIIIB)
MISSCGKPIDIHKIKAEFEKRGSIFVKPVDSDFEGFEWKLKPTNFFNQITIGYKDQYSTKSIKIFPNGSIQVAGCCDLFDCMRIVNQLSSIFKEVLEEDEIVPIDSYRVVMINTNFSLNYNVNLIKVAEHFSSVGIFQVSFEPDNYSAVMLKFKPAADMKEVTTSIFSTGKIILTGAETLREIAYAYNIVNQYIYKVPGIRVSKTEDKDTFETFMGYRFDDWVPVLQGKGYKPWIYTRDNPSIKFV